MSEYSPSECRRRINALEAALSQALALLDKHDRYAGPGYVNSPLHEQTQHLLRAQGLTPAGAPVAAEDPQHGPTPGL